MITAGGESDARLVTATRQSRSAFVALYQRYLPRVYRYVYRRVGNQQDAEDVTASVFTEALESLEDYREQGSFAGWLFTIAHHRVADHHRQQRERISLEEVAPALSDSGPGLEAQALQRDRLERVAQALDELTPDERAVDLTSAFSHAGPGEEAGGLYQARLAFDVVDPGTGTVRPGRYHVKLDGVTVAVQGPWTLAWSLRAP